LAPLATRLRSLAAARARHGTSFASACNCAVQVDRSDSG
jgi:hypothetical protein